ncbi:MAG: CBS domain-containing protein [Firmicutes bacterium]|nr:CBS domain-containing protein [Bacillota bacterium]
MKVAFFLIPKNDVVCLSTKTTLRQALERMERHRHAAVPLIDEAGCYVGTITEGDLLWKLKDAPGMSLAEMEKITLKDITSRTINKPVRIDSRIVDLLSLASEQNFVPVVDDQGIFIGIVRRREIIEYCAELIKEKEIDSARR